VSFAFNLAAMELVASREVSAIVLLADIPYSSPMLSPRLLPFPFDLIVGTSTGKSMLMYSLVDEPSFDLLCSEL